MATVIIVEDHHDTAEMLSEVIAELGVTALSAPNVARAKEAISTETNLVLVDHLLPDGTGLEFIRWLRESSAAPQARVILMTGLQRLPPVDSKIDLVLQKPFEIGELLEAIRRAKAWPAP